MYGSQNTLFQKFEGEEVTLPKISRMIVEVTMPEGAGPSIYQAQAQLEESSHYVPMMQALVSELHAGALEAVLDGETDDSCSVRLSLFSSTTVQ